MAIYRISKAKMQLGSQKVKNGYLGAVKVYSSGNIVTYVVRGVSYTQEYDEGESVLSPSAVTPTLSGATFIGWSTSPDSAAVVVSLVMEDSPITLYAIFKYDDITFTCGYVDFNAGHGYSGYTVDVAIPGTQVDTDKYGSVVFMGSGNRDVQCNNINGNRAIGYYRIGSNQIKYGEASFGYDSVARKDVNSSGSITMSISSGQGIIPIHARLTVNNGYGYTGRTYINSGVTTAIKLTGRTVVG